MEDGKKELENSNSEVSPEVLPKVQQEVQSDSFIVERPKTLINGIALTVLILTAIIVIFSTHRIYEYERGVMFRFGKYDGLIEPGLHFVLPIMYDVEVLSLREVVFDIQPQDVITADGVTVSVDGVVYYKVVDPRKAILNEEDFKLSTIELAKATLRKVCGQSTLIELNSERQELNEKIQKLVAEKSQNWGVEVPIVEIKNIILHEDMQEIIAEIAIAERKEDALLIQ